MQAVKLAERILFTNRKSFTAVIPKGYRSVGAITFKAHRNGGFTIQHENREIRLDLVLLPLAACFSLHAEKHESHDTA